ncbi:excinuclease ABC, A subunit [Streptomyces sp. OV198]|nr:excinuclease ABC, A subunit [Streptomyces sp. OV198]
MVLHGFREQVHITCPACRSARLKPAVLADADAVVAEIGERPRFLLDVGPGAGAHGGHVVHSGTARELLDHPTSLTGACLSGRRRIPLPAARRPRTEGRAITGVEQIDKVVQVDGRCEHCYGDGTRKVEMNFLPDIYVPCEVCHGAQYNRETLDVHFKCRSIADVLGMTIEDSLDFFAEHAIISRHLRTLHDVGLGHVKLGQSATTLSGGEAQCVKLAAELQKRTKGRTLYVLDEPTNGPHVDDVRQLLAVLHRLVDQGNTVVVIEHDLDVIKTADRIVDIGPEGGHRGGTVIAEGTPEQVAAQPRSYTGQFLRPLLERS